MASISKSLYKYSILKTGGETRHEPLRAPTGKSGEKDPSATWLTGPSTLASRGATTLCAFPPWAVLSMPGSIVFQLPDGGIDRVPPLSQGFEL
jgi:hypothetical protein